jgi:hypothetical protein
MAFKYYNANPSKKLVIDCTVRAISKFLGASWDSCYIALAVKGFEVKNMQNSNEVWHAYLKDLGYYPKTIPNMCPNCYSVKEFCEDHPHGAFVLATGDHVIAVVDGDYYDTWDSGNAIPVYYWCKGDDE